ncbi:hypothetical protein RhiirC2_792136 [Rhizophagus irregularis]|uniref:FAR1 domain-containing protein n=1 Tax=Rhizophagus irregularis TaxID=588596 RepID=A0A2N1MHW2_9GLOM|nr:hypothetical protein RhiirC2_792136 [Rhizophagus irregularis]
MALPFSYTAENNTDSTVELGENEILKDTLDLLMDDEQLSDEEEEADEDKELLYPIVLEMVFTDWTKLDEWFDNHGLERGFAFTITHSEKDKEDGLPRRRIYSCMRGRRYVPRKEAQINDERDTGHHTVEGNHNENIGMVASRYRKLNSEMTTCGVRAAIRNKNGTSDAGSMYLELMRQQREDPTFYVDAHFEGQDNHLVRLFVAQSDRSNG